MKIVISKSTAYHGKNKPDTEDFELTVEGEGTDGVAAKYKELRNLLNKMLKEDKK